MTRSLSHILAHCFPFSPAPTLFPRPSNVHVAEDVSCCDPSRFSLSHSLYFFFLSLNLNISLSTLTYHPTYLSYLSTDPSTHLPLTATPTAHPLHTHRIRPSHQVPLLDLVCACTAGFLEKTAVVDLNHMERGARGGELVVATLPTTGKIVTLEVDGGKLAADGMQ
jgi:hypothetical protein